MSDASSKLLLVPKEGNQAAESAAAELGIPVAVFDMPVAGSGTLGN